MKKYNEGYALPFVLIVMVIICLIGVSVLSFSLNNLQSQKRSIERMKDQYTAEGKIEQFLAKVLKTGTISNSTLETICNDIEYVTCDSFDVIQDTYKEIEGDETLEIYISARVDSIEVFCKVRLSGDFNQTDIPSFSYTSGSLNCEYLSYEIANGGE